MGTAIWGRLLVFGLAGALLWGCDKEGPSSAGSSGEPYRLEVAVSGLDVPWEIVHAPDGRWLITERTGAIRVVQDGKLLEKPLYRFDQVYLRSEAGVLGLALDPQFADNRYLYVYYTYAEGGTPYNRVVRLTEKDGGAELDRVLLDKLPAGATHDGGRIKFGPDGMLYVATGDAGNPMAAQDVQDLSGKILRIRADGTIPQDNPFPGSPVYSLGHRNPQGLAWHPESGMLYSTEHGPSAHDELNLIAAGSNYGWPLVTGDETTPTEADAGKQGPGALRPPVVHSGDVTWAPSGAAFIRKGPWQGSLLIAQLRGEQLMRVTLSEDGTRVESSELLLQGKLGRIRNVAEGPDGSIYLLTNNRDGRGTPRTGDDQVIRIVPGES